MRCLASISSSIAGNNCVQPNIDGINHTAGDWAVCLDGTGWVHIDATAVAAVEVAVERSTSTI